MSEVNYNYIAPNAEGQQPIKMWTRGVPVEEVALSQLDNLSRMPFLAGHVAAMPDVHWGMGATVGSVIPTEQAIIPAAVGVDIGCGMVAQMTSLMASDLPDNLHNLRTQIESRVPHGRTDEGGVNDRGAWSDPRIMGHAMRVMLDMIVEKHPRIEKAARRAPYHMGTLGTGNHFIEICLDEQQRVWIMLHSGSRGIGNRIGQHFINLAKEEMRRWYINLPDADLAYLPAGTKYFDDYLQAVHWAQDYAKENRMTMLDAVHDSLRTMLGPSKKYGVYDEAINCHHNYVSLEKHFGKWVYLTRKGAVSAKRGEKGIIPGSMGVRSYIVEGLGNVESYCSCSHGAGRKMSRGEAKRTFTLEDHARDTAGVECRKDIDVLDETPKAYKDIEAVMAAQSDLVKVTATLKQVLCVKG